MMLAEPRFCQHPSLWTCARCSGCESSRSVLFSNIAWGIKSFKTHCNGKEGLKLSNCERDGHSQKVAEALHENSASAAIPSRTSSVEEFAGTLRKAAPASPILDDQQLLLLEYSGPSIDQPDPIEIRDEDSWSSQSGPFPGDLAEVEAFCRIFRIAEQVHNVIMDALRFVNEARGQPVVQSDEMAFDNGFEGNGVPLLEEKVVSGLGCIGALLHQQKQEVLGGRFNHGSSSLSRQDHTHPLAHFRAAMKRCCEQLEIALLCYFPADDVQFAGMHSRFQKLKNVCFDVGYPRTEGSPAHADIPNWGAVRLWTPRGDRTPETDNEVMFWKGGQVTGDGVQWLVDNGFKVIVDLRAEGSVDHLAKSALNNAVLTGKLRVIKLPVGRGKSPTKDQVLEFAKLAADPESHPLYLQSQQGIGRTSVMAARWREIALRNARAAQDSSMKKQLSDDVDASSQHEKDHLECQTKNGMDIECKGLRGTLENEVYDSSSEEGSLGEHLVTKEDISVVATPFEAQRPPVNFFSKQAMSKLLKGRQVTPNTFRWRKKNVKLARADSFQGDDAASPITIEDPAGRWGLDGPGIPRAERREDGFMPVISAENESARKMPGPKDADIADIFEEKKVDPPTNGTSFPSKSEDKYTKRGLFRFSGVEIAVDESEEPAVVGDMCASTTGVVRLQSRRKAEMYLVRTDGFSCTREKVKESTLAFTHPSTQQQMLMWKTAPKTVLLLKKLGDELMQEAQQVASFLHYREGMNVIVEPEVHDRFARVPGFGFVQTFYNQDTSDLHERVDFVVCLGGDGVILHASNLFRNAVPPVVSFNLGSLGFLTAHPFEDFMQDLSAIIHGNNRVEGVYITLRMRLHCELFRNGKSVPGKVFDVLNEMVVDRGSNPYLCKIECYERNRLITKVQADGVIVATPTGSTAYSTAAGGSMVHPNVPCMLFTPICPHSLSFRPVILPDSALLELKVPEDARSNAWVSFDGKRRQQLSRGDSVRVCMSEHPLPTVNKSDQTDDWFQSLVRCLNWNERLEQKALSASS